VGFESLDLADFEDVAFSVETVIHICLNCNRMFACDGERENGRARESNAPMYRG